MDQNDRRPFRLVKSYGAGKPAIIFDKALNTIGPDRKFVTWVVCTHSGLNYPPTQEDFAQIDVSQWIRATSFLGVPIDSISIGYSRSSHLNGLFDKIWNGTYIFPRNKHYRVIKRAYKRLKSENREFEKKYFSRRLYFKSRLAELKMTFRNFPRFVLNSINSEITLFLSLLTYRRLVAIPQNHLPR